MAEPQTGIRGYKYTEGTETSNIRDVASRIALLQPDDAPLLAFINGLKNKKKTGNPTFEWFEDDLRQNIVTVAGAETIDATVIDVTTGQGVRLRVNDLLLAASGEVMRVTGISTDAITVVRDVGSVISVAMVALDELVIIGTAMQEGANAPTSVWKGKVAKENYVQIFRDMVEMTVTQANTDSYGGDDADIP